MKGPSLRERSSRIVHEHLFHPALQAFRLYFYDVDLVLLVEVALVSRISLLFARGFLSLGLALALFPGLLAADPLALLPVFRPLEPFAALLAVLFELFDLTLTIKVESQYHYLASTPARYRTFCKRMLAKNIIDKSPQTDVHRFCQA